MARHTWVIVLISFGALIGGCPNPLNPVERATGHIEKASENLSKGLTDLSTIDPVALNKLLKENEQLRQTADLLREKLQAADGIASIPVGPGSEALFEITGYTGQLRLSAWVDTDRNKFIDNKVLLLNEKPFVLHETYRHLVSLAGVPWQERDKMLAADAQASVQEYLKYPFVLPSPEMRQHSIYRRFRASGDHSVMLQVTPEALDKSGHWAIEYNVVVKTGTGEGQVIAGRMDGDTSRYKLGEPLPPKEAAFLPVVVVDK